MLVTPTYKPCSHCPIYMFFTADWRSMKAVFKQLQSTHSVTVQGHSTCFADYSSQRHQGVQVVSIRPVHNRQQIPPSSEGGGDAECQQDKPASRLGRTVVHDASCQEAGALQLKKLNRSWACRTWTPSRSPTSGQSPMWTLSAALLRKPHRGGYAEQLIGLNQSTMTRYHPQSNRSCSGILTVWYVLAIGNQPVGWAWAQQAVTTTTIQRGRWRC